MIRFSQPYLFGSELKHVRKAIDDGRLAGNGQFTKKCHEFFEETYGFGKCLLTTSCTDALEMASLLADIQPGDEVIVPAYTFVSSANAFVLRGAKIVFADSKPDHPNIDEASIVSLITPKTKAIVVVHYGGVACDMDPILTLAHEHGLLVIEDAAQAVDSLYKQRALGSIGHLAAFSFHETKNIIAGEGGMLVVNDERFKERSEVIWEKGTNRTAFYRGEVDKYGWVDVGSSFLPSELVAAFLWGQLEHIEAVTSKRRRIWDLYHEGLQPLEESGCIKRPVVPDYATNNGHVYYFLCADIQERTDLLEFLKGHGVGAVFHYLNLQSSPYFEAKHDGRPLPNAERYADTLIRLPLHLHLSTSEVQMIIGLVNEFFK